MRSTTRWSPTSSVFSIDPDGMTKFCAMNVRMNKPTTSTEQMLATASNGVSSVWAGSGAGSCRFWGSSWDVRVRFFVILRLFAEVLPNLTLFQDRISALRERCAASGRILQDVGRDRARVRVYHWGPVADRAARIAGRQWKRGAKAKNRSAADAR